MRRRDRARFARNQDRSIAAPDIPALLRASAAARGLSLDSHQVERLEAFLEALLDWRETTSLVAQRDPAAVIAKHVEDAFAVATLVQGPARIADLGTGAGFPGMVIAIVCPQAEVLLVEPKRRRASYLRDAIRKTQTPNAPVIEARAEDLPGVVQGLDLVVSRAVWPGDEFFEAARPLLRVGGWAVAMRTPNAADRAVPAGYRKSRIVPYRLSGGEERVLMMAEAG